MFDISIYLTNGEKIDVDGVSKLSLVNNETFGKAPIVSEENWDGALVVFVNPANVAAIEAVD